ncbi:MAG: DUF1553 domain-containing protein, partial [Lacipirellulaceae bacterium]
KGETVEGQFLTGIARAGEELPRTRLGLAEWLVSDVNPLTHRVFANRVWAQLFGRGLVETEEDFGSQGTPPTHPELLDHLAIEYRDTHGGSLKGLIRSIVTTRVYQQAYVPPAARDGHDPRNTWLSSGPRFRLGAEAIRDGALAVAGLLSPQGGGPPVMPPQPDGLWRSAYSGDRWVTSDDERRYRRAIYVFWKRTSPYPSMEAFDATTREVCQVRRIPTNTPLQSLVTLNDPVYVESAARWAQRSLVDQPDLPIAERIAAMVRGAIARPAEPAEVTRLEGLYTEALREFIDAPADATSLLDFASTPGGDDPAALAAWTVIASGVLNLDEFLTRP